MDIDSTFIFMHYFHSFYMFQGFSVDGQENIQEIRSKRLYLCQFLSALMLLRPGNATHRKIIGWYVPSYNVANTSLEHHEVDPLI